MPFYFGMAALASFLESEGMKLADVATMGENMPLSRAFRLMLCGFKDGARKERIEFNYTEEDMADWLDDDMSLLDTCVGLFAQSLSAPDTGNGQKPGKKKPRQPSQLTT